MNQPKLPDDPQRLASFYMHAGSANTLLGLYNYLLELQTFYIDQVWPVGSEEYKVAADVLEVIKYQTAVLQEEMASKSQSLLED